MTIKVTGVEGRKFLDREADALTQDFLMINHPVFPSGNIAGYLREQLLQEKVVVSAPEEAQQLLTKVLRTVNTLTKKVGLELYPTALGVTKPETHILGGDVLHSSRLALRRLHCQA